MFLIRLWGGDSWSEIGVLWGVCLQSIWEELYRFDWQGSQCIKVRCPLLAKAYQYFPLLTNHPFVCDDMAILASILFLTIGSVSKNTCTLQNSLPQKCIWSNISVKLDFNVTLNKTVLGVNICLIGSFLAHLIYCSSKPYLHVEPNIRLEVLLSASSLCHVPVRRHEVVHLLFWSALSLSPLSLSHTHTYTQYLW